MMMLVGRRRSRTKEVLGLLVKGLLAGEMPVGGPQRFPRVPENSERCTVFHQVGTDVVGTNDTFLGKAVEQHQGAARSEEHTSELQSH